MEIKKCSDFLNEYADTPENRDRERIVRKRLREIDMKNPKILIEDEIDFLESLCLELSFGNDDYLIREIEYRINELEKVLNDL